MAGEIEEDPLNQPPVIDKYDKAIASIEQPVTDLFLAQRRQKRIIRGLIASVILDVVLSVVLGFFAVEAHNASEAAKNANYAACQATNEFRALDLKRWLFVLDLSKQGVQPKRTEAEKKAVADRERVFREYIVEADKPRVCIRGE